MDLDDVSEFLRSKKLCFDPQVEHLGEGEGHTNYLAIDGNEKLVVRTRRMDVPIPTDDPFGNEAEQLAFLESQGVDFAPRSLYLDMERHIHVISYVRGADHSIATLPNAWLERFIDQVVRIESLPFAAYEEFCRATDRTPQRPKTTKEHFEYYTESWYKAVEAHSSEKEVPAILEWLKPKYEYLKREMEERPGTVLYLHGDLRWHPGGGNLRLEDDKLWFIDWEHARFVHTNRLEIADIIASIPDPDKNRTRIATLIDTYQQRTGMESGQLHDQILYSIRYTKFIDVLWAAWRFLTIRSEGGDNWKEYRSMTDYRLVAGDYYFDPEIMLPVPTDASAVVTGPPKKRPSKN